MTRSRIHQRGFHNHHHAIFGVGFIRQVSFPALKQVPFKFPDNTCSLFGESRNSLYKSDYCIQTDRSLQASFPTTIVLAISVLNPTYRRRGNSIPYREWIHNDFFSTAPRRSGGT